jgi:hypothetical protein
MPIRTLRDLDLLEGSSSIGNGDVSRSNASSPSIHHIPGLPESDTTLAMLRRIHREFDPIIQRRGYRVLSISEMCCCGDGLDYEILTDVTNNANVAAAAALKPPAARKRRKRRIMSSNILGYNQTRGRVHTIHLRMRDARHHHRLFCYEDVAGTMAHELAHCEHSAHNAQFYKLMDEILEQHAVLLARGFVADTDGFPMNSSQTYVLGQNSGKAKQFPSATAAAARAADQRLRRSKWMPQGPQVLGGDNEFRRILGPQEAAGMAAELRRLRDEQWCHPCEIDNNNGLESDEDEDNEAGKEVERESEPKASDSATNSKRKKIEVQPPESPTNQTIPSYSTGLVDLTGIDSDDEEGAPTTENFNEKDSSEPQQRSCWQCTFLNRLPSLACRVCQSPLAHEVDNEAMVRALLVADEVQQIQQDEVRRSEEQFGFNIYGTAGLKTKTMKHLK